MLTDTHCHLFKEYYKDLDKVLKDASNNGVNRYIVDADNIASCHELLETTKKYGNLYITLGIHPENCDEDPQVIDDLIKDNIDSGKIVAVGEIGLDYYYTKDNKDKQQDLFRAQLDIAKKYNLPVIVHSREATKDTIDILKEYPDVHGVIHCFSGSLETALEYIKMGYYIGVGGVLTFKNSKLDDIIKELPVVRILFETDAPFLAPEPHRGHTNEPKYIKDIAEYASKLFDLSLDEISAITESNVNTLFFKKKD